MRPCCPIKRLIGQGPGAGETVRLPLSSAPQRPGWLVLRHGKNRRKCRFRRMTRTEHSSFDMFRKQKSPWNIGRTFALMSFSENESWSVGALQHPTQKLSFGGVGNPCTVGMTRSFSCSLVVAQSRINIQMVDLHLASMSFSLYLLGKIYTFQTRHFKIHEPGLKSVKGPEITVS